MPDERWIIQRRQGSYPTIAGVVGMLRIMHPVLFGDLPGRFLARERLQHHLELHLRRMPPLGHGFCHLSAQPWP
jgi:hypothetical protein